MLTVKAVKWSRTRLFLEVRTLCHHPECQRAGNLVVAHEVCGCRLACVYGIHVWKSHGVCVVALVTVRIYITGSSAL